MHRIPCPSTAVKVSMLCTRPVTAPQSSMSAALVGSPPSSPKPRAA